MAAPNIPGWQSMILKGVNAPVTPENIRYMDAWARAEGGSATNNPFNTTQHAPGAGSYNSVGVRNYTSPQQGIQATIDTLNNGRYGNIIGALRKGTSAMDAANALAASPWGTGSLVQKVLGGGGSVVPPAPNPTLPVAPAPAPALVAAPALGGTPPAAQAPPPQRGIPAALLAAVNQGNEMFGLDPLPASLASTPVAAPTLTPPPARSLQSAGPGEPVPVKPVPPAAGSASGGGIAKTALTQIGIPYQWGGAAKLGGRTDCSGLLQASARANGINIGRTTYVQWTQGTPVPLDKLQPGDAVFFHPGPKGPEHVAIYVGGGKIVEDPRSGESVHITALAGRGPMGARRY
jgi:cell wall-associated NlpC family hydrolase